MTIQCLPGKRQIHNLMRVTKCYKQLSSLTRKYLVYAWTSMKIYKLLAVSRKLFVVIKWVVEPDVMRGLQPAGATRVTLDVIIPSPRGLTPEKWKQTATLSPLDWPSNYSLLRLWHVPKDLHQFVDQLNQQMNHRHMLSRWEINYDKFTSRVLYQLPAHYLPAARCGNMCRLGFP